MTNLRTIEREPRQRSYGVMAWNQVVRGMTAVAVGGIVTAVVEVIERVDYPAGDYPGLRTGVVFGALTRLGIGAINLSDSYFARQDTQRDQNPVPRATVDDEFETIVAQLADPQP